VAAISLPLYQGIKMSQSETRTRIKPVDELKEPILYRVVYINDHQTSMDFVVESLITHFNYTTETATQITVDIHETGSAIVAVLPYEIAEHKGIEITMLARAHNYPLQIKLEPESTN